MRQQPPWSPAPRPRDSAREDSEESGPPGPSSPAAPPDGSGDSLESPAPKARPGRPRGLATAAGGAARLARQATPGSAGTRIAATAVVTALAGGAVLLVGGHANSSADRLALASSAQRAKPGHKAAPAIAGPAPQASPLWSPPQQWPVAPPPRPQKGHSPGRHAPAQDLPPGWGPPDAAPVVQVSPRIPAAPAVPARPAPARAKPAPKQSPSPDVTVHGTFSCLSDAKVVGVWLVGQNGGSGWATWTSSASAPEIASFSRTIPRGEWQIHVGCGGTSSSWHIPVNSGWASGTSATFTCDDIPGSGRYKECYTS